MPGFDPDNPPIRRGFYNRIKAAVAAAVSGGTLGVVAIPITGDWGPTDTFVEITSSKGYDDAFGASSNDSRFTVVGALTGDGSTKDGASKVIAYRLPLSGQVAASHIFTNTTPATALTLTAKYKGTKGNSIAVTIQDHPTDATKDQVLIYDGTTLKETWSYTETDIANLVSQLNDSISGSRYVTGVANITGVHLTHVTSTSLASGANGSAISSDYTAAMTKFESQKFNIFVVPNLTDGTILAAVADWITTTNDTKRRVMLVEGGAANEALSDAIARSALTSDSGDFANFGYNMFKQKSTGSSFSSAQMAGYFAGMIAGKGIISAITFDGIDGFDIVEPSSSNTLPTFDDIDAAITGGVNVFTKDSNGIRCESEMTTFTDTSNDDMPYEDFSSIKGVRTLHQIDNDLTDLTNSDWIGKVANTPQTRVNYLGILLQYFRGLEGQTALRSGLSSVSLDDTQDNTGDTLWPVYNVTMTKTIQHVLATGQIG